MATTLGNVSKSILSVKGPPLVLASGIEPPTHGFSVRCSTSELHEHIRRLSIILRSFDRLYLIGTHPPRSPRLYQRLDHVQSFSVLYHDPASVLTIPHRAVDVKRRG